MPSNEPRVALDGSARAAVPDARDIGPVAPDERIELTIRVRPARPGAVSQAAAQPGSYLSRQQLRAAGGADPAELVQVEAFAREHGLDVLDSQVAERRVVIAGPAARLSAAFGVTLRRFEVDGLTYRGRTGSLAIPASLAPIVEGVFGLDDRPQARPHFRIFNQVGLAAAAVEPEALPAPLARSFSPPQIASLYNFVKGADGSGQSIALIELGGGLRRTDLDAYFKGLGLASPSVTTVSVDGGAISPPPPTALTAR